MKNYKIYTIALLLFTVSTLASCIESPAKTNIAKATATKITPKNKTPQSATITKMKPAEFKVAVDGKKVQLIDVRTPREYTQGHIESAININVYDKAFTSNTDKLDKSKPVYVYCRSGARSMKAAQSLKNRGYNVVNLNGGTSGWMRSGFKLVK